MHAQRQYDYVVVRRPRIRIEDPPRNENPDAVEDDDKRDNDDERHDIEREDIGEPIEPKRILVPASLA